MKKYKVFLLSFIIFSLGHVSFSQVSGPVTETDKGAQKFKSQEEKEIEVINFDNIKAILKKDLLEDEVTKKKNEIDLEMRMREKKKVDLYFYPKEEDYWPFLSEYWLVKKAPQLKWDFERPDYGLKETVEELFQNLGLYEKKFKLLLLDSPTPYHVALPYKDNEFLFIISAPFIRTMDLTKLEISVLILEDYFRSQLGYFKDFVLKKESTALFGTNFYGKNLDKSQINDSLDKYDDLLFKKGFTFQQQFETTKKIEAVLKNNPKYWSAYFNLLNKIDSLIKYNSVYKDYSKIYPSPEMQLNWIKPKENG